MEDEISNPFYKKLWFWLIVIITISAIVCLTLFIGQQKTSTILLSDMCNELRSASATDAAASCDKCDKLSGDSHNQCVTELATSTKNLKLCLTLKTNANECLEDSLDKICEATNDARLRDSCYLTYIQQLNNKANLCDKIVDLSFHDECISNFLEQDMTNAALCKMFKSIENQQVCLALTKLDTNYCDSLPEPRRGQCYTIVASQKKSTSTCDKLTNNIDRQSCYEQVAAKQPGTCEKLDNERSIAECYGDTMSSSKDPSLCEKISDEFVDLRDHCYDNAAGVMNNIGFCAKISNIESRDICYINRGKTKTDCDNIQTDSYKGICYANVARFTDDLRGCDEITNVIVKDNCYNTLSLPITFNFCDRIIDQTLKAQCSSTILFKAVKVILNIR